MVSFNHVPHVVHRNCSEKINIGLVFNTEGLAVSSALAGGISYIFLINHLWKKEMFCLVFVAHLVLNL